MYHSLEKLKWSITSLLLTSSEGMNNEKKQMGELIHYTSSVATWIMLAIWVRYELYEESKINRCLAGSKWLFVSVFAKFHIQDYSGLFITIQRCSLESQKGAIAMYALYRKCLLRTRRALSIHYWQRRVLCWENFSCESEGCYCCCTLCTVKNVSWEPERHYHYSKMFWWEPEGCYCHVRFVQKMSVEYQKGIITIQRCSVESQMGAITVQSLHGNGALLLLNGTLLKSVNTPLVLSQQYVLMQNQTIIIGSSNFRGNTPQGVCVCVLGGGGGGWRDDPL